MRALMRERGISMVQLAEAAEVSRTHAYEILRNPESTALITIERIARKLKTTVGYLLGDGTAPPDLSPYDRVPEYRGLLDNLQELSFLERERVASFLGIVTEALRANDLSDGTVPNTRQLTNEPPTGSGQRPPVAAGAYFPTPADQTNAVPPPKIQGTDAGTASAGRKQRRKASPKG